MSVRTEAVVPRPFLTDFGLAKSVTTGSRLTRTGQALGTPAYMSPEQALGETSSLTPATDVWSLGCCLYEMLAARTPFEGETTAALIGRVLTHEAAPIRRLRPDVPRGLELVLRVALAGRAERRFPEAGALRDDLDRVLAGEPPLARPARPAGALFLLAAALLGTAAGAGILAWRRPALRTGAPSATDDERSVPERLAARARVLRASDPREAADLLGQALAADPSRNDWRLDRGLLLMAVGDTAGAQAEWERVPARAAERPAAALYRAFERLLRSDTTDPRPELAEAARGGGDLAGLAEGASAVYRQEWAAVRAALRDVPGWEAALLRAYTEHQDPRGDRAKSVREYAAALESGPPLAWIHLNRGVILRDLGDHAAALAAFDEALRLQPGYPKALRGRGKARLDLGDRAGALADLDEAVRSSGENPDCLNDRGIMRMAAGDLPGAEEDFSAALARDPGFSGALLNRGSARLKRGDARGALADYDEAFGRVPGGAEDLRNRALARRALGDSAGAVADCTRALALRADFVEALQVRADARRDQGNARGALEDLTEALRLQPGDPEHLARRGIVRAESFGDSAGALADFTAALRGNPRDWETFYNRGNVRRDLGDMEGAVADFREAIRIRPDHPSPHYNLARIHAYRREWADAIEQFREVLRLSPDRPDADDIRAKMADCEEQRRLEGGSR